MSKKQKKDDSEATRTQGSSVPIADRLWAHRIADDKVAAERELGATRRETPSA